MSFDPPARAALAPWRDALRDSALDSTAKLVGFVISTFWDAKGEGAFPSRKVIAAGASLNREATITAAIGRLRDAGFLMISQSLGRSSNGYTAAIPTVREAVRLEPYAGANGSDVNRTPEGSQPYAEDASTVRPGVRKGVESVESGTHAIDKLTPAGRAWLDRIGVEYALDEGSFVAEATKVLKISAAAAERLRLELLERTAA